MTSEESQALLDTSVLLDIYVKSEWSHWASETIIHLANTTEFLLNPIIYAELAPAFKDAQELDLWLEEKLVTKIDLPFSAAFRASKAFIEYRKRGGIKTSPLCDFYIGAHAEVEGLSIITRDQARFGSYFPNVCLISPEPPSET